jgi:hypothetical protein
MPLVQKIRQVTGSRRRAIALYGLRATERRAVVLSGVA